MRRQKKQSSIHTIDTLMALQLHLKRKKLHILQVRNSTQIYGNFSTNSNLAPFFTQMFWLFHTDAENPKVISVFLSKEHKLHTTRSWEFLGLRGNDMNSAWPKGRFGENTIIANIDTGN